MEFQYFLETIVPIEKLANNLVVFLYLRNHFSLMLYNIFLLYLMQIFYSGFGEILMGLLFLIKFRKFLSTIQCFSAPFSFSPCSFLDLFVDMLAMVHMSLRLCSFCFFPSLFIRLDNFYWSMFKFSDSTILSSRVFGYFHLCTECLSIWPMWLPLKERGRQESSKVIGDVYVIASYILGDIIPHTHHLTAREVV